MFLHVVFLVLLVCGYTVAYEGTPNTGNCSDFDSCRAGGLFRTCSCDGDCYKFGSCCSDAKNFPMMTPEKRLYECRSDRTVTPVYAKNKCSKSYVGHDSYVKLCEDAANDPADVLNTVLYTGAKSKKTYWNKNCAICNKEDKDDMKQWTVQVACPSKHGTVRFGKYSIEKNLTFNKDISEWGLVVQDGFLACSVHFIQPHNMMGKLEYCAPNIVSTCPAGADEELVKNCRMYHAERRQKSSGQYFRNAHCALCNGVAADDLECVGLMYGEAGVDKDDDVVKVAFDDGKWLKREGDDRFVCSVGNTWDPYADACKKTPEMPKIVMSAQEMIVPFSILILVGFSLVNKYLLL